MFSLGVLFSKISPCCNTYQYFIPFCDWILFHCMAIPFSLSVHQSVYFWVVYTFWLLWINTALNIHGLAFVWAYVFNFLGYDCWVIWERCLVFWRTTRLFSKVSEPFHVSTSDVWGLQTLYITANTCYYLPFDNHLPSGCEIVPYCGFDLHFPNE